MGSHPVILNGKGAAAVVITAWASWVPAVSVLCENELAYFWYFYYTTGVKADNLLKSRYGAISFAHFIPFFEPRTEIAAGPANRSRA